MLLQIQQYIQRFFIPASYIMQFSEFIELESFKQDAMMEFNVPIQEDFYISHVPHQYHSVLDQIHEINHSRSLSSSIMDVEPQYDQMMLNDDMNPVENQEKQQFQDILFTPSKIFPIVHRKSNMFMSTTSNDEKTQIISSQEHMTGIKIYYFSQNVYKFIQYNQSTTIDSLINKALLLYRNDYSLDQTLLISNDPKNYQMRFVMEQGGFNPDMTIQAVGRDRFLVDSIFQVLVLIVKNNLPKVQQKKSVSPAKNQLVQEKNESITNEQSQIRLNIFNQANMHITSLILSRNDTLDKAIQFLEIELKQKIILTQNLQDQLALPSDLDVKNLGTYKLFAKKKKYLDQPDPQRSPLKIHRTIPKLSTCQVLPPIGITEASRYQQFQVIKINRRGTEQTRILGIDQTKLYNYDVAVRRRKAQLNLLSLFTKTNPQTGTKRPERPISEIKGINSLFGLNFQIILPEKTTQFRAQTQQDKEKIVRKLKFLIQYNNQLKA